MSKLDVEVKRAEAQGAKRIQSFSGAIVDINNASFDKGDIIEIPESFEVYEQPVGTNKVQFIFVKVQNNNIESVKKLYPTTFTKSRSIANEDGTLTGERISTKGTAVDLYRSYGTVADAMEALKGKKIQVTDILSVRVLRFGTTQVMNTNILTLDLI